MIGSRSTYWELIEALPPRPIRSEEEYQLVQARIDALIDKGELTEDEQDYLDLLGTLVEMYERETLDESEFELRGVALVKALLEEYDLRQKDLVPIFKTESIVSAVLNGRRSLTVEHIDGLARYFNLPHELFFAGER